MDTRAYNLRLGDAVDTGTPMGIRHVRSLELAGNQEWIDVFFTDGTSITVPRYESLHVLDYERKR